MPVVTASQVIGVLGVARMSPAQGWSETEERLLLAAAEACAHALERVMQMEHIRVSREETFRALGVALEYRDVETKGHIDRVVALADALGRRLSLDDRQLERLRWGAYLHDVGKIGIPDAILLKPGPLTPEEWEVMRRHPVIGCEMLGRIPHLPPETLAVVRHHHERWDGRGYPDGLAGTAIPLLARIFAVVDVYDALTHARPYKPAWPAADARRYIAEQAGKQFDPEVVRAFLDLRMPG